MATLVSEEPITDDRWECRSGVMDANDPPEAEEQLRRNEDRELHLRTRHLAGVMDKLPPEMRFGSRRNEAERLHLFKRRERKGEEEKRGWEQKSKPSGRRNG